jgi:hypothetical protein
VSDNSMVYVATAPCGCVYGIDCESGAETARNVAEWIARGSAVDRRRLGDAKAQITIHCPHTPRWGRAT